MAQWTPEEAADLIAKRHKLGSEWRSVGIELTNRGNSEFVYEATFVRHAIDYLEPLFEETPLGTRVMDAGEPCTDEIICRGSMERLERLREFAATATHDEGPPDGG